MKTAAIAALLLFPALSRSAAPVRPFADLRTDPRFELLAMVQLLAGADRNSAAFFRHDIPYDRAAEAWFKPYARHPVVEKYQQLTSRGLDYLEMYTLIFGLSDPPGLDMEMGKVPSSIVAHAGGAESLKEFQLLLADFARASRFGEFYEREAGERAGLVSLAGAPFRNADLSKTFRLYTGWDPPARETMIVSPFAEPVLSVIFTTTDPDGTPRLTILYGPEVRKGKFQFRAETRFAQMMLEMINLKLRTAALPFSERLERSASLYPPVGAACAPTWYDCARRQIAFSAGARLLTQQGNPEMAALWPIKYARIGMPYMAPLIERLKEYEANRARYPTLTDFLPRLIDVFDDLAAKGAAKLPFFGRFDDSWNAPGPAAFIVPGGEDGAALRAAALALQRRRRPDAQYLTDAQALQTDLAGKTLVVVGTPDDNAWLARRWPDLNLPARVERNGIRFNARPGEDLPAVFSGTLGYATSALNPDDGSRPVLLYTGVTPEAAAAALTADPGPADYAVLSGTSPIKIGVYEKSRLPWRLK